MDKPELLQPSKATLDKYGLSVEDWVALAVRSGWTCGVCTKLPPSCRLYIDHEHVPGWKKMAPEDRKKYVRGLACYRCNRFILNARINATVLRAAANYLDDYEEVKWRGVV